MIKINLVPVKEKKKQKEILVVIFAVAIFGVLALGMAWFYIKRVQVKSNLKEEIRQVEEESKGYQEKINEVKDLEAKEATLESFKKTIKGISESQRKVLVAVDRLAISMTDGIWLTTIAQVKDSDSKFIVSGYAFSPSNLQSYFTAIQKQSGFLKDATLNLKSNASQAGTNPRIQSFDINVTVQDQGS